MFFHSTSLECQSRERVPDCFPTPDLLFYLRVNQAPGGIGEMFLDGEAGKEFALIRGHKGFVRAAMAHGVSLVPVYGEQVVINNAFRCGLPSALFSVVLMQRGKHLPPRRYNGSVIKQSHENAVLSHGRGFCSPLITSVPCIEPTRKSHATLSINYFPRMFKSPRYRAKQVLFAHRLNRTLGNVSMMLNGHLRSPPFYMRAYVFGCPPFS